MKNKIEYNINISDYREYPHKFIKQLSKIKLTDEIYDDILKKLYNYDFNNGTNGYVYCVHNKMYNAYGDNIYKLGMAQDIEKRLLSYTTYYIDKTKLILKSNKVNNYRMTENLLFQFLEEYRIRNDREFFNCDLSIIEEKFIKINNMTNNDENIEYDKKYMLKINDEMIRFIKSNELLCKIH